MLDAIQAARLVYVALPEARSLLANIIKAKPSDYPRKLFKPTETAADAANWLLDKGYSVELENLLVNFLIEPTKAPVIAEFKIPPIRPVEPVPAYKITEQQKTAFYTALANGADVQQLLKIIN